MAYAKLQANRPSAIIRFDVRVNDKGQSVIKDAIAITDKPLPNLQSAREYIERLKTLTSKKPGRSVALANKNSFYALYDELTDAKQIFRIYQPYKGETPAEIAKEKIGIVIDTPLQYV